MQGSLKSEKGIMGKTGEIFGERVNETGEEGFGAIVNKIGEEGFGAIVNAIGEKSFGGIVSETGEILFGVLWIIIIKQERKDLAEE